MLIAFHRHLRRHRAHLLGLLAVLAFGAAAATTHAALMSDGMGEHGIANAATVCIVLGATLAVAGGAVLTARRIRPRPLWLVPDPAAPAPALVQVCSRRASRAGPPSLLQVFRF